MKDEDWKLLGIEESRDRKVIADAYAARLTALDPYSGSEDYDYLSRAYLEALAFADRDSAGTAEDGNDGVWLADLALIDQLTSNFSATWAEGNHEEAVDVLIADLSDHDLSFKEKALFELNAQLVDFLTTRAEFGPPLRKLYRVMQWQLLRQHHDPDFRERRLTYFSKVISYCLQNQLPELEAAWSEFLEDIEQLPPSFVLQQLREKVQPLFRLDPNINCLFQRIIIEAGAERRFSAEILIALVYTYDLQDPEKLEAMTDPRVTTRFYEAFALSQALQDADLALIRDRRKRKKQVLGVLSLIPLALVITALILFFINTRRVFDSKPKAPVSYHLLSEQGERSSTFASNPNPKPLRNAVVQGDLAEAASILASGLHPNHPAFGQPHLLQVAVENADLAMVRLLLEYGARAKPFSSATDALTLAKRHGHLEIAALITRFEEQHPLTETSAGRKEGLEDTATADQLP